MRAFEYVSPNNKAQAMSLLATSWDKTEIIAGGTDLLALMKDHIVSPQRLINLKDIKELRGVYANAQGMRIGALTTLDELANDAAIKKNYPAFAEALMEVASPQIRNQATLGGNLCQRPRCWYFRNGFGLLPKDESGKELVMVGENRYHAILGNSGPAKFVSPSTIAPILIAYGASLRIEGRGGKRELPLEKFFVIPNAEGQREHDLLPDEIVTELILPPAPNIYAAHYEIRQKAAFDWPLAVVAVALKMDSSSVRSVRIVLGHVAPVPWRSPEAESVLAARQVNPDTAQKAAGIAVAGAHPLRGNAYKVQLACVAVRRAILKAAGGTV
ncbi:MAG: xanthine dehydrogenase family protein subunit M [Candidatus Sulfotelmatobacter sp.]